MASETERPPLIAASDRADPTERSAGTQEASARVRVIYVAGVSHTGSTLLGHILGELEDTCYAGEIRNTWQRGILDNRMCTCNASFAECPFWQTVIERLPFPAEERAEKLSGLRREALRPALRLPLQRSQPTQAERAAFAAATEALYAAVSDVAGVRQLVDSSKSPLYAALLHRLPTIDLRVVHLVRDPRATVYSHLRRYRFGHSETFRRSVYWLRWNLEIERLARSGVPYARIRYEDLVDDPAESLNRISNVLALPGSALPIEGRVVHLSPKHIFSGNRAGKEIGPIVLRNDSDWKSELPRWMQTVAHVTTLPLSRRYGYHDG